MIAVIAPEPAAWVAPLAAAASALDEVAVFAPWARERRAARWLPARVRDALDRRAPPYRGVRRVRGWIAVEAALGAWAGGRADRLLAARFARRRLAGALAARWLPAGARLVIAPSLGARRVFAAAAARGAACVLVEDLPDLRRLHLDLDRAAARQPEDAFLRRYRAPAARIAAQEAERALAQLLLVRSRFALEERLAAGVARERLVALPEPMRLAVVAPPGGREAEPAAPALLLAGPATARSGLAQALAAAAQLPGATLLVRPGDGSPPALLDRPGVRAASRRERERLEGVDLVLAPALCESHPPEVGLAAAAGIPLVATRRAAGFVDLERAGREVAPGDFEALAHAISELLSARRAPLPPAAVPAWPALAERLRPLLSPQAPQAPSLLHARGSP